MLVALLRRSLLRTSTTSSRPLLRLQPPVMLAAALLGVLPTLRRQSLFGSRPLARRRPPGVSIPRGSACLWSWHSRLRCSNSGMVWSLPWSCCSGFSVLRVLLQRPVMRCLHRILAPMVPAHTWWTAGPVGSGSVTRRTGGFRTATARRSGALSSPLRRRPLSSSPARVFWFLRESSPAAQPGSLQSRWIRAAMWRYSCAATWHVVCRPCRLTSPGISVRKLCTAASAALSASPPRTVASASSGIGSPCSGCCESSLT